MEQASKDPDEPRSRTHRTCGTCGKEKHLRWFPLLRPGDPLDNRRDDYCNTCTPDAWRQSESDSEPDWTDTRKLHKLETRRHPHGD